MQNTPRIWSTASPAEETELKRQLDAYLQAGQIEPARSHFGAGLLFARKKDNSLRLCMDYRALNNITLKDTYHLPRIDELLDNMAGAEFVTKMDLQQGYHQIRVKPENCVLRTAYCVSDHVWELPVSRNAVWTLQCHKYLSTHHEQPSRELPWFRGRVHERHRHLLAHLGKHLTDLLAVLLHFRAEKPFAKLKNALFGQREIEFCGYLVNREGIKSHLENVRAIANWPIQRTVKDVRAFWAWKSSTNVLSRILRKLPPP